jgi:hypothetical protein
VTDAAHLFAGQGGRNNMMRNWIFLAILLALTSSALADGLPKHLGQCSLTRVKKVETRLTDGVTNRPILGSGSAIEFANGGYQVSYQQEKGIDKSRTGDRAKICLVSIPENCPLGDDRGRVYRVTNLRTHGSWTLPDSEHMCGGA